MNIYELRNVTVTHGGRTILDVGQLDIGQGLTYSLQGPNGAGKSTLLGILGLLTPPHCGEMRFMEHRVTWTEKQVRPLRRHIGFVEQHPVMFSCSVRENVGYGLQLRGVQGIALQRRVDDALDIVGLRHLSAAYAPRLSGGEAQRVAIARALACQPHVLLLDEPTASVDTQNRLVIEHIIADMRDSGEMTIVFCTHNRGQAQALCPQMIYLEDGQLVSRLAENIFGATFVRHDEQIWCRIADRLSFPAQTQRAGRGRVRVPPEAIHVKRTHDAGLNSGIVTEIRLEGAQAALSVDAGRAVCARMDLATLHAAQIRIGDLVQLNINPQDVECSYLE